MEKKKSINTKEAKKKKKNCQLKKTHWQDYNNNT